MEEENNEQKEVRNVIFDNKFSVKFTLDDGKVINNLSDNIWSIELPGISFKELYNPEKSKILKITVRSIKGGIVEEDIYNSLARTGFNISLSLYNPNVIDYEFKNCTLDSINTSMLKRNSRGGSPFNTTLTILVKDEIIHFGQNSVSFEDTNTEIDEKDLKND